MVRRLGMIGLFSLNETFLRWRFHDLTHFDARAEHFLAAGTVGAACGPFVTSHHDEDDASDQGNEQQSGYDRYDDGDQLQIGFQRRSTLLRNNQIS